MDYEAAGYQKLQVKQYPARSLRETAEGKYWKRFTTPVVAQQVGVGVGVQACQRRHALTCPCYSINLTTWSSAVPARCIACYSRGCMQYITLLLQQVVHHLCSLCAVVHVIATLSRQSRAAVCQLLITVQLPVADLMGFALITCTYLSCLLCSLVLYHTSTSVKHILTTLPSLHPQG